jgi:uncharacterized membrane protein YcaP (DUF421 family)
MSLINLGVIGLHTFITYIFLIFCLSQLSHRLYAQVDFDELLIITLLGSAVETSMIVGDTSLLAGIVSAATLLASNWLVGRLVDRWGWFRHQLLGHPMLLVCQGNLLTSNLRKALLTKADILEGIRAYGFEKIEQVKLAVLEIDGSISVVPIDDK